MNNCPRCQKPVDSQALKCPHCDLQLKAFGHPGIPLYRATEGEVLCDRCVYGEDDTCNFPQRPYAKTCTMFRDQTLPVVEPETYISRRGSFNWLGRYRGAIALGIIIIIALLLALG
jgi:hypothetical protein